MNTQIVVQVEADIDLKAVDVVREGFCWQGTGELADIMVDVRPTDEGHGFGLTELLEVAITVGATVSADLIADAIRAAVKGTIRRVSRGDQEEDGTKSGIKRIVLDARDESDTAS
ncbi:hypothetical protein [Arthrobacter sp. R4-81]